MSIDPSTVTFTAYFRDGTFLSEPDFLMPEGPGFVGSVGTLDSFSIHTPEGMQIAIVVIRDDMRPIFGRMITSVISQDPSKNKKKTNAVFFGWHQTIGGRNYKFLTWITPDGLIMADRNLDDLGGDDAHP